MYAKVVLARTLKTEQLYVRTHVGFEKMNGTRKTKMSTICREIPHVPYKARIMIISWGPLHDTLFVPFCRIARMIIVHSAPFATCLCYSEQPYPAARVGNRASNCSKEHLPRFACMHDARRTDRVPRNVCSAASRYDTRPLLHAHATYKISIANNAICVEMLARRVQANNIGYFPLPDHSPPTTLPRPK